MSRSHFFPSVNTLGVRRKRLLPFSGVLVLLIASCGAPPAAESVEGSTSVTNPHTSTSSSSNLSSPDYANQSSEVGNQEFPLDRLMAEVDELDFLVHEAMTELLSICMTRSGFNYEAFEYPSPDSDRASPSIVLDDIVAASERGFAPPLAETDSLSDEPGGLNPGAVGLDDDELEAWGVAFFGTDFVEIPESGMNLASGGCLEEAENLIYQNRVDRHALVVKIVDLRNRAWILANSDPTVAEAVAGWASCMADNGWQVSTPEESWTLAQDLADDTELAVAEATCANEHGVNETFREVLATQQADLITAHPDVVADWVAEVAFELAQAEVILE